MANNELVLPDVYNTIPLRVLRVDSRRKLSSFLDIEGVLVVVNSDGMECDIVNDYSGLAELAGFNYQDIMNMKRQKSPTTELLDRWTGPNGHVGKLWTYLHMMKRFDVLSDCRELIVEDCLNYEGNEEPEPATQREIYVRVRPTFDAFICFAEDDKNDRNFLYKMIEELEVKKGLKLFVPGRDVLQDSAEESITAYHVARCKRVVILMSKKFLQSAVCDFVVKFAHSLAPGVRSKKLIPVIREKNTLLPRILRFLPVCDFTEPVTEWVWDRLSTALIATVGPTTYFDDEDPYNPYDMSDKRLKYIKFPVIRRLDEYENSQ